MGATEAQFRELYGFAHALAKSICRGSGGDDADDLVQETMLKAWEHRESFIEGSNFKAWVFTIMRNLWFSHRRRSWRSIAMDHAELDELGCVAVGVRDDGLELERALHELAKMDRSQQDALVAMGRGATYDEYAAEAKCCLGTSKSRVGRARAALKARITPENTGS